jgi:hypothetical protein
MAVCAATGGVQALPAPLREIRVLRCTFRRDDESVVCELGLNRDDLAYELRVQWPSRPSDSTRERFDDALSALHRHAAIERILVDDGWLLEAFESERVSADL